MSDCPNCDYLNPDNAKFCQECGTPLAASIEPQEQTSGTSAKSRIGLKLMVVVALVAIAIGGSVALALSQSPNQTKSPTSPTSPNPTTHQASWQTVARFSGGDNPNDIQTDRFDIRGSDFRVNWSYQSYAGYERACGFFLFVFRSGNQTPRMWRSPDLTSANQARSKIVE